MTALATPTTALAGDPRVVTLRSSVWELDVLPGTGACLGAGRIRTGDGVWRDLLRPTRTFAGLGEPERCASFPMIPWSNRVAGGVLRFRGRTWQLQQNAADGTAIHGAARYVPWQVTALSERAISLELDTRAFVGMNFPWNFVAGITYALDGPDLEVTTSLRNVDDEPFPAGLGHHPYFERALLPVGSQHPYEGTGPLLEIPAHRSYELTGAMPSGPSVPVAPRADFRTPRRLGGALVDDVLTAFEPGRPVRMTYDDPGLVVEMHRDPAFSHLVVYAPRGRSYFAVEPATNVNDGFSLHDAGVPGTGVLVLAPDEQTTATFTITTRTTP
ncbi:aldose 1-epimerase [Cellulomonas composti]|uniref:Aldose 1-epimerase n=1 Tax=Cellulomonas composti TaxID=266130 RepID=A0A511J820_9CELL|nr:aldose epimerase [Cellulomonas composti]GEL94128.1 aldose 1-epimerase [Cellulomonas composti]